MDPTVDQGHACHPPGAVRSRRHRFQAARAARPLLLESRARTIEQMCLINALGRFVDLAQAGV